MKKNTSLAIVLIALAALLSSCTKVDQLVKDAISKKKIEKKYRVKQMIAGARTYSFHYNKNGRLDSLSAEEGFRYVYRVNYNRNGRIDSVGTYMNGNHESSNINFTYNSAGKITGYTYWYPQSSSQNTFTYEYDAKGRIAAYEVGSLGYSAVSYNNQDDAVQIGAYSYQYDQHINPLHLIPDLFAVMVEEFWILEQWISLHNSISKAPAPYGTATYTNRYDSEGRLIQKTGFDSNGNETVDLVFVY